DVASRHVSQEGLTLLAQIVAGMTDEPPRKPEPMKFEIKGKSFCSVEWESGNSPQRIVVFSSGFRFYVCEARIVKHPGTRGEGEKLFMVQQSLLGSLVF